VTGPYFMLIMAVAFFAASWLVPAQTRALRGWKAAVLWLSGYLAGIAIGAIVKGY
jgi:hypothetical protein